MKVTCSFQKGLLSGRLQGFSVVQEMPGNQRSWKSAKAGGAQGGGSKRVGGGSGWGGQARAGCCRGMPKDTCLLRCNGRINGLATRHRHTLQAGRAATSLHARSLHAPT